MAGLKPHLTLAYYVPDPGEAADWYRDRLGFEIHADHRADAALRWVTASPPGADWHLVFSDVTVHGEGELADRFRAEVGFSPHFMLVVDDVAAAVRELRGRGVVIAEEPHEAPFGGLAAAVEDLHGNALTLADGQGWATFRGGEG